MSITHGSELPNQLRISAHFNHELFIKFDKGESFQLYTGKEFTDKTVAILQDTDGDVISFCDNGTVTLGQPIKKVAHFLYDMVTSLCSQSNRHFNSSYTLEPNLITIEIGEKYLTITSPPCKIEWNGDDEKIEELNKLMSDYNKLQIMR